MHGSPAGCESQMRPDERVHHEGATVAYGFVASDAPSVLMLCRTTVRFLACLAYDLESRH